MEFVMNKTSNRSHGTKSTAQTAKRIREKNNKSRGKSQKQRRIIISTAVILVILFTVIGVRLYRRYIYVGKRQLSEQVLAYKDMLESSASRHGLEDYVDYLLAIMQVESGGQGKDVLLDVIDFSCGKLIDIKPGQIYFYGFISTNGYFKSGKIIAMP